MITFPEFWTNFLANFIADALIAIAIYIAITRPSKNKEANTRLNQALGLLKAEMEANKKRAECYKNILQSPTGELKKLSPLRYTRGAWNALKESGFIPQLNNPLLVYNLLRVNEAIVIADMSLNRVLNAIRERKKTQHLVEAAIRDTDLLLKVIKPLLSIFGELNLPEYLRNDLYEIDQA